MAYQSQGNSDLKYRVSRYIIAPSAAKLWNPHSILDKKTCLISLCGHHESFYTHSSDPTWYYKITSYFKILTHFIKLFNREAQNRQRFWTKVV